MTATAAPRGNVLDRALRLMGDVRAGEGARAAMLGLTLFLLLSAYYLLKVAREELVLSSYDAETKVYIAAGQAIVLIPAVAAYGWLSARVGRFRLLAAVIAFFGVNLVVIGVLHGLDVEIALPFFVWVGVFNVFVISLLWAFANDLYDEADGRRLFAVIGLGSSLGAIAGAYAAEPIGDAVGIPGLFVTALVLLGLTLLGAWWIHHRSLADAKTEGTKTEGTKTEGAKTEATKTEGTKTEGTKTEGTKTEGAKDEKENDAGGGVGGKNAFALLVSDRYFVLIAVLLLLLNCENTLGEYLLDRVLLEDLGREVGGEALDARVREFKSIYFGSFNTLGLLLQLFLTGRVMKKGGAGAAILILPVVALLGQLGVLVAGLSRIALAVAKVAENAVDYSINGTARNALFLVVSREAKYKVKVLLDSVIVRFGDVTAGLLVLGAVALELPPLGILAIAGTISALWLATAFFVYREHHKRADGASGPQ